jgi:hypothetical protein
LPLAQLLAISGVQVGHDRHLVRVNASTARGTRSATEGALVACAAITIIEINAGAKAATSTINGASAVNRPAPMPIDANPVRRHPGCGSWGESGVRMATDRSSSVLNRADGRPADATAETPGEAGRVARP